MAKGEMKKILIAIFIIAVLIIGCCVIKKHIVVMNFPTDVEFFDAINLSYPGLEAVKTAVDNDDYATAKSELVKYMKSRRMNDGIPPDIDFDWRDLQRTSADIEPEIKASAIHAAERGSSIPKTWDKGESGDTDFLNRFPSLLYIRIAYFITGDEKYAIAYGKQIDNWIKRVPFPEKRELKESGYPKRFHHPWSPLNTGIRALIFVTSYYSFCYSPNFDENTHINMLKSLLQHARYLYVINKGCFHGRPDDPTFVNMQSTMITGLAYIGLTFPEFKESENWTSRAFSILRCHLRDNVYPDGVQKERTTRYQHSAIRNLYLAMRLGELNKVESEFDMAKYEKMFDFILYTMEPDGKQPPLGDSANKRIDASLVLGALLFDRGEMKYFVDPQFSSYLPLLFDKEAIDEYNLISPVLPSETSFAFPDAGYYVMRSDWDLEAGYLIFTNGPYGGAHSHNDRLSFELYAYGNRLIADSGICNYDDPNSSYFRSTKAHNTILIDKKNQPDHLNYKVCNWTSSDGFDFIDGEHDGYKPVVHRRKIFFVKPEYWIMSDLLSGSGKHEFDNLFHFLPTELTIDSTSKTVRTSYDGANIIIAPADPLTLTVNEFTKPISPAEGAVEDATHIKYHKSIKVPTSFDVILYPYKEEDPSISISRLTVIKDGRSLTPTEASGLEIRINDITDYFMISHITPDIKSFGNFEFDGEIAYLRKDPNGEIIRIMIKNGSYLAENGRVLVDLPKRRGVYEIGF